MTPTTPLPPLPPPRLEDLQPPAPSRLPLVAAVAALVLAAVFAVLWLGARGSVDETADQRDAAIAERDAATQGSIDANAQLRTVQDELADARELLDEESEAGSDVSSDGELQDLKDRAEELSAEVDRLEAENDALATALEDVDTPVETAPAEPDATATTTPTTAPAETTTTAPAETTTTTNTTEPTPDTSVAAALSFEDIGDQISRLFRPSVLGALQKNCLGQFVVEDLGEQRVVDAIASDAPDDDEEFMDVVSAAADFCFIDQSAIFG